MTLGADPLYVGVDIGGTKVLALVAKPDGTVLGRAVHETGAFRPTPEIVKTLADAALDAVANAAVERGDIRAVGLAVAGAIDMPNGVLVWAPQMPGMANTPIVSGFREHWDIPTAVSNDANLAALAEQHFGAARGYDNVLFITVSTGIGGGIVLNGQMYGGAAGFAGELGHMSVDAHGPYGRSSTPGAFESLCSGIALARITSERVLAGERSSLETVVRDETIVAEDIFSAMRAGDALAKSVIEDAIEHMGVALTGIANILNPGIIVIGGGLSNEWDAYIAPAVAIMRKLSFAGGAASTPVVPPTLGADAGAMGGVALAANLA